MERMKCEEIYFVRKRFIAYDKQGNKRREFFDGDRNITYYYYFQYGVTSKLLKEIQYYQNDELIKTVAN